MVPYLVTVTHLWWATWRTGSLLAPMGLHFANNSCGAIFFGARGDSAMSAMPALFLGPPESLTVFVGYSIAQTILVVATIEPMMRRREATARSGSDQAP